MVYARNDSPQEPEVSFGLTDVLILLKYVRNSVKRRRWLAVGCFVATVGLTATILAVMPRTYRVTTRILTNQTHVITGDRPGRSGRNAMARSVDEIMKSRAMVEKLIISTISLNPDIPFDVGPDI